MKLLILAVLVALTGCKTTPPTAAPDCAAHPERVYVLMHTGTPEWHCLDNNGVKN